MICLGYICDVCCHRLLKHVLPFDRSQVHQAWWQRCSMRSHIRGVASGARSSGQGQGLQGGSGVASAVRMCQWGQGLQGGSGVASAVKVCQWGQGWQKGVRGCKCGQGVQRGSGVVDLGLGHCACHTRQPEAESTLSMLDLFLHNRCARCCSESAPKPNS